MLLNTELDEGEKKVWVLEHLDRDTPHRFRVQHSNFIFLIPATLDLAGTSLGGIALLFSALQ
jgi:hypothetical protein